MVSEKEELIKELLTEYYKIFDTINDFDKRLLTIKGWGVTMSLAALGMACKEKNYWIFLVAVVSSLAFWILEYLTKLHQMRYYVRMREIECVKYQISGYKDGKKPKISSPQIDWSWANAKAFFTGIGYRYCSKPEFSGDHHYTDNIPNYYIMWIFPHVSLPHCITFISGLIGFFIFHSGKYHWPSELQRNSNMSLNEREKSSGCLKVVLIIFTFLVLVIAVFYFAFWRVDYNKQELAQYDQKIEQRIAFYRSIPDDENGWKEYKSALDKMVLEDPKDSSIKMNMYLGNYTSGEVPKEKASNAKRILELNKETFSFVDKGFKYSYVFDDEIFLFGDPTNRSKNVWKIPSLCKLLIIAGDMEQDEKKALTRYMEAVHLYSNTIENFIGNAHSSLTRSGIHRIKVLLMYEDYDPSLYRNAIPQLIRLSKQRNDLSEKMKMHYKRMAKLINHGLNRTILNPRSGNPLLAVYFRREIQVINKMYLNLMKAFDKSDMEGFKSLRKLDFPVFSKVYMYVGNSLVGEFYTFAQEDADSRGLPILAALKLYKIEKGEYPESLDKLVPKYIKNLPGDNFASGKPTRYQKKGKDGFILYGVGIDGKDDGGKDFDPNTEVGDFVIYDTDIKTKLHFDKDSMLPLWMKDTSSKNNEKEKAKKKE